MFSDNVKIDVKRMNPMKKLILVSALAALVGSAMAADPAVTGGKITFQGKVVDQTCSVSTNSRDQIVVLQNVPKNKLAALGAEAMPTPFHIDLEGCKKATDDNKAAKTVKASFSSVANVDPENEYSLKNKVGDTYAKNVNIRLYSANGTDAIYPSRQTVSPDTPTTGRTTYKMDEGNTTKVEFGDDLSPVLHYIAKYYATGEATVGDVETSVNFELTYE